MIKTLHSREYRKLTAWLKKKREVKGLTMRQLSVKMNTSHSFIGKVEQRERRLDIIEFLRYCEALGASPIEGLRVINKNL